MRNGMTAVAMLVAILMVFVAPAAAQEGQVEAGTAEQPVQVGKTEVSWSGAWEFDEDASSDEIVTLTIVDEGSIEPKLATYAELGDETVDEAGEALDVFAAAFLTDPGVSNAIEGAGGALDDGTAWKVFTYDLGGVAVGTLFTVSEREDNDFVVSTLTATLPEFAETVAEAQGQVLLDGEPAFLGGIDAAGLLPAPAATPQATPED